MGSRILFLSASAFVLAGHAGAQTMTVSAGAEYTTGDYGGGSDTDVLYAPFSLGIAGDNWSARAILPYLRLSGPGVFLGEDVPIVRDPAMPIRGASENVSGLGDLSLSLTRTTQLDEAGVWELDITGRVKVPTADQDKGLGTGETDYSLAGDLVHNTGAWSLFAGGGYRINGDPDTRDLNNIAFGSLGAVRYTDSGSSWGFAYDYSQAVSDGVDEAHELSSWLSFGLSDSARLQVYGLTGLSNGGPDYGGGARLILTFKR